MTEGEADQRKIVGYSISDPELRAGWISLVEETEALMGPLGHEILFHGTSVKRLPGILRGGVRPTEVDLAVAEGVGNGFGSFWGDVRTAAAYAEDTARERDGSLPALIAVRTEDLLANCELHPDLATLDFPLKGLTRLDDPEVYDRWVRNFPSMSWREAMEDLRAVVALHDLNFPKAHVFPVRSVEDLKARCGETVLPRFG